MDFNWDDGDRERNQGCKEDVTNSNWVDVKCTLEWTEERKRLHGHCDGNTNPERRMPYAKARKQ